MKRKINIKMFEDFKSDKLIALTRINEILTQILEGSENYKISNTNDYEHEDFENHVPYKISVEIYNNDEILSFVISVVESKLSDETEETKYEETYSVHYTNDSKELDVEFPDGAVELDDNLKKFFEFKYNELIQQ